MQPVASLVIDIGARSANEAEEVFGIRIGEPVVAATEFYYDEKGTLCTAARSIAA